MIRVTDYTVVRENYATAFSTECSKFVRDGWQPRGQMEYVNGGYTQVFVRYE